MADYDATVASDQSYDNDTMIQCWNTSDHSCWDVPGLRWGGPVTMDKYLFSEHIYCAWCHTNIHNCAERDGLLVMSLHWSGWMVTQMWGLDGTDGSTNSFRDGFLFKYCCYSRLFILFAPSEPVQSFQYLTKEAWKLYSGVKHNTLPSQCGHPAIHQLSTISTSHFHHV